MQYKIAVSGAAVTNHCCDNIILISKEVGREIARSHCVLVSGATTGVPYFSAVGCKEAGGFNVGFSPAESEIEHIKRYRLPVDAFDVMIYTGSDYPGRDIIMTKSADAVIIIAAAWEPCTNLPPPSNVKNQSAFCLDPAVPPTKSLIWSREHSGV